METDQPVFERDGRAAAPDGSALVANHRRLPRRRASDIFVTRSPEYRRDQHDADPVKFASRQISRSIVKQFWREIENIISDGI